MSNYGYTNEAGEPIMSGEAYRFEQQLDADYAAYDRDDYLDPYEYEDECDGDIEYCPEDGCPNCSEEAHAEEFFIPEDAAMESALFGDC